MKLSLLPFAHNVFLSAGCLLVAGNILLAVCGEVAAPYPVDNQDLLRLLTSPSFEHPLGTDPIGRDVLSRTMIGARHTVSAALLSVLLASILGVPAGAIAGYFGGIVDAIISSAIDVLLTIPLIVLAIAVASVSGAGLFGLVLAASVSFAPRLGRLIRSRVLEVRNTEFVTAARALGLSEFGILVRHVLPHTSTVLMIEATLLAGQAVLVATALGFLGLGVQPPAPEWGTMLGQSREYMEIAPHMALAPGVAITILVLGFNLLGDGLRDWLDPAR